MNKLDVQKRVLKNGEMLSLDKFSWCDDTKTFSSSEDDLVISFDNVNFARIIARYGCTVVTGSGCTVTTEYGCTVTTRYDCTVVTGSGCTVTTESGCTVTTEYGCTVTAESGCTVTTEYGCTVNTRYDCTVVTGPCCTVTTESGCTVVTGYDSAIIRKHDFFEAIAAESGAEYQLCPSTIPGHLKNGYKDGKPHIIADGILSEVLSKKGNFYKVINHGELKSSFLIEQNGVYSHGSTLKEAQESLIYKIKDKDTSEYEALTLDSVVSKSGAIKMYRTITGACESGTRSFVESVEDKTEYSVSEIIKLTDGRFGNRKFKEFFS